MRSTLAPCKCGKYASILPASKSETPAAVAGAARGSVLHREKLKTLVTDLCKPFLSPNNMIRETQITNLTNAAEEHLYLSDLLADQARIEKLSRCTAGEFEELNDKRLANTRDKFRELVDQILRV